MDGPRNGAAKEDLSGTSRVTSLSAASIACTQTLKGHSNTVSLVCSPPAGLVLGYSSETTIRPWGLTMGVLTQA